MKHPRTPQQPAATQESEPVIAQGTSDETAQTEIPAPEQTQADPQAELVSHLQRLQAEFDNYRKRADADVASAIERGKEKTIKELLPVLDSFALAKKHAIEAHAKQPANAKVDPHKPVTTDSESELSKGFTLIHNQLKTLLDEWRVTEVPAKGIIDPKLHEVYLTETAPGMPAGTILQVLQPGYIRNGTVLRTAKVKAARN